MSQYQKKQSQTCGCCEGIEKLIPLSTANRAGLDSLKCRVGTHATFLETMQACLTGLCLEPGDDRADGRQHCLYPLRPLTTRQANDPAMALLDAWATVAAVLTFYQERIANEGYLRTATERRSILELARLIGYKLQPGVAASVYLAFTLEEGQQVEIPAGTQARSKPGPGETPQTFETSQPLATRAAWNDLAPRLSRPQYITRSTLDASPIYFEGTAANLEPNDPFLFDFEASPVMRRVESADVQQVKNRTAVILQTPVQAEPAATSRAVDATRKEIQQTIRQYLNMEDYEISSDAKMAQRVIGTLAKVEATMSRMEEPDTIEAAVDAALTALGREYETAKKYHYENLEPWVGELVQRLAHHKAELAEIRADDSGLAVRAAESGRPDEAEGGQPDTPNNPTGLGDLIAPVLKPASEQPANPLQLRRSIQQVLGPATDFTPGLLTTVKPQLKGILYPAWGNAQVTAPSAAALQSIEVLRVKASPFGHNAPLKPIYGDNGRIVGHEEWPLAGALIGLRLSTEDSKGDLGYDYFPSSLTAKIFVTFGGETNRKRVDLESDKSVDITLGDIKVEISLGTETFGDVNGVKAEKIQSITIKALEQEITLTMISGEIKVDGYQERLAKGNSKTFYDIAQKRTIGATYSEDGNTFALNLDLTAAPLVGGVRQRLQHTIALDAVYNDIKPGGRAVIVRADTNTTVVRTINKVQTVSKAAYGISGKVTQLILKQGGPEWLGSDDDTLAVLRNTTIHAAGEELTLAEKPIEKDVAGQKVELDALYDGLEAGRWVVVSGERTDIKGASGVRASELVMLAAVEQKVHTITTGEKEIDLPGDTIHTSIQFANDLSYTYKRDTVTIHGNVVKATHGETRQEVLGSGDGSQARQQFELKKSPLTYLPAPTPEGTESTLAVRVNEVEWPEADNLFELEPSERGYITRTDNEDVVTVVFGDGKHGARLPSGIENVRAAYRAGIGQPGNVNAEQISLLASRPLGVKGVVNPLPASGGANRERRDQARRNAPLAVMALDRLVSVRDYADFARTFAGIGKVSAKELSDGRRKVVHLTIAGADDISITKTSDLYRNVQRALLEAGDPHQPLRIDVRELKLLFIEARIRILPEYQWESVAPDIRAALLDTFSFQRRRLGQDVVRSEVISVIQHVPGVAYVDVDTFDAVAENISVEELEQLGSELKRKQRIVARKDRIQRYHVVERQAETWTSIAQRYGVDRTQLMELNQDATIKAGNRLRIPPTIRPAQLVYLSPDVPDTLILNVIE